MPNAFEIRCGNALDLLRQMPDESVHCCVTSPPYWGLRDYGVSGQIGIERTPGEYVENLVSVFREVRRVLRSDCTLWLNLGDCYATGAGKVGSCPGGGAQGERFKGYRGSHTACNRGKAAYRMGEGGFTQANRMPLPGLKPKDLVGIPWAVAFALRADGWWLRSDIIWHKPNPLPESVGDRPTKAHEYIFLLAKSERYYYDADAIKEAASSNQRTAGNKTHKYATEYEASASETLRTKAGLLNLAGVPWSLRNKRSVWTVPPCPTRDSHFATYPIDLVEPCILAGCPVGGTVLDPFAGAGTTGLACLKTDRNFIGFELNPKYIEIALARAQKYYPLLLEA